jgi:hypothetical protein
MHAINPAAVGAAAPAQPACFFAQNRLRQTLGFAAVRSPDPAASGAGATISERQILNLLLAPGPVWPLGPLALPAAHRA